MNNINIIVYLGDSTALGRDDNTFVPQVYQDRYLTHEFRSVYIFNTGTVANERLSYPAQNHTLGGPLDQFGLNLKLAALLNGANKAPVSFTRHALGSTSLAPVAISGTPQSFDKATGTMYATLLSNITTSHNLWVAAGWVPNYVAVVCLLGLNDANTLQASIDFEANLTSLINNFYVDCAEVTTDTPFLICKPNVDATGVSVSNLALIRDGIDNVHAALSPQTKIVNLDGLPLLTDLVHQNWEGEIGDDTVADRIFAELY